MLPTSSVDYRRVARQGTDAKSTSGHENPWSERREQSGTQRLRDGSNVPERHAEAAPGLGPAGRSGNSGVRNGQGKVHSVVNHGDYRLQVILAFAHLGGTKFAHYAHLATASVTPGQEVTEGTQVGTTGFSGNAANLPVAERHLHFEIPDRCAPGSRPRGARRSRHGPRVPDAQLRLADARAALDVTRIDITRAGGLVSKLAGEVLSLRGTSMKAHGRTNESRGRTDETWRCASEARGRADESRWLPDETWRCVSEARWRADESRWLPDESRWHAAETRRCASEARRRAHVLHGSTNQCSWAHLRASRTGVSGSLASGRVSSEHWTTLVTAENASKGQGQSFEGEAKSVVDAPPSKVRLPTGFEIPRA